MTSVHPPSTAQIGGHPLHPMLIPLPLTFFISAFGTDLIYLFTGDPGWAAGSFWLLVAGLASAALAALTGLADFLGSRRVRAIRLAWAHMIGNVLAVLLEAANLLIRLGGQADAVEPVGVILSGIVVAILAFTGWAGGELVYRHGVAVNDESLHEAAPEGRSV